MNRLRCLSASLVAALAAGTLSVQPDAQVRGGAWFSLQSTSPSPLGQQIERLVVDVLGNRYGNLAYSTGAASTISGMLATRGPTDLTFVAGRAADITEFVRNDRFQTIAKLRLEIVNARLGAAPFYLFTNAEKERNLRQPSAPVRVLYASRAGTLQPSDIHALIAKVLGTQPTVPVGLNSPDELARRLLADNRADGVDVVGIYDQEPSQFLHDFLRAYDVERASVATTAGTQQLVQMLVFPTGTKDADRDRLQTNRLQSVQGNLTYALVRFDDVAVEGLDEVAPQQKDGILAVTDTQGDAAPDSLWVMSNLRSVAGEQTGEQEYQRLRRLLGDAYFVGLMSSDDFQRRCENGGAPYGAYLLDAQLADRQNLAKALAFWSDIVMRSGTAASAEAARLADQRVLVESMLRQRLDVQLTTSRGRADLVARLSGPRAGVREQFSDADGSLFGLALEDIQAALRSTDRSVRLKRLSGGRAKLLALIEKGSGPACRGKDLGLFGRGLDPFFYLGLVDAYAGLESSTTGGGGAPPPLRR
ncbi:MAG: hypothetical protein GEU82_04135 [Luteitalea sp.]|nr:hypothetical protein [Luteitalea sp.]